jgi:hypothetical protein
MNLKQVQDAAFPLVGSLVKVLSDRGTEGLDVGDI